MGAKLGFIPWSIDDIPFTDSPSMIVGIDTVGKIGDGDAIMALVSTNDCNFS